ncbi:MAG: cytochrome C assembly protein [Coriobacteriaceae bacterium]|nr:cytochrome C assembly protein [Coriobacteriaceae bacterium]
MTALGNLLMALALMGSIVSVGALFYGRSKGQVEGEQITNVGYFAAIFTAAAASMASALLVGAFFAEDFRFQYVVENHSTDVSGLSWLYKLSGLWAGREGSLLFWAWLLTLFIAYVAWKRLSETDELSNMALAVAGIVQIFFFAALFIEKNNPFKTSPADWIDPASGQLLVDAAMNPLLQHWAMIIHPPTLFIGYAGLTIAFAYAMAALITGDGSKKWVEMCDRITVFSWLFLGIGIGLGAIWAYVVLGWGGYWAWDPVENASLLPWLTGVGLLHSFTIYRKRDGFKGWAIMLATVTFVLVLLGTFITRSGVVQSVHAFEEDPLSFWLFMAMMLGALFAGGGGLFVRWERFKGADEFESLTSKEAAYYFNNVLMLVASVIVAYLTVTSALPAWMPGGGKSFGAATYDAVARPVGILYVLIMALCPMLVWRKTDGATFWRRVKWPLAGAGVVSLALVAEWWINLRPIFAKSPKAANALMSAVHNGEAVAGLIVASLAVAVPVFLFVDGANKRAAAKGESWPTALGNIIFKARSQSGGYITHLGIGIILMGLVGSTMFVDDIKLTVDEKPGSKFTAGGYEFVFTGYDQRQLTNGDQVTKIAFDISRGGRKIGSIAPGQIQYAVQQQTRLDVDVLGEPLRDVFVIFEGGGAGSPLSMNVKINPLIRFVWWGFALTIVGTSIAVWPKRLALAA